MTNNNVVKVTPGFVVQVYDKETRKCVSQSFFAGDDVQWEDEFDNPMDPLRDHEYQPFNMEQPNED